MFSSLLPLVRTLSRPSPPIVKLLQAAPSTDYNVTELADGRREAVNQETARRLHQKTSFREEFFGPKESVLPNDRYPWAVTVSSPDFLALKSLLTQKLGEMQVK